MSVSRKRFHRLIGLTGGLLAACTTVPTYQEVQLPAYASPLFTYCGQTNGALIFQLNRAGTLVESFDMEWAAQAAGDWALARYSPFGQTLFELKYASVQQKFSTHGVPVEWLSRTTVDTQGLIRYDGHKIGLKPEEAPCFLAGRMPINWLRMVVAQAYDTEGLRLDIRDRERRIVVHISKHGGSSSWIWKATVGWDTFWGIKEESLSVQHDRSAATLLTSESLKEIECRWSPKAEE